MNQLDHSILGSQQDSFNVTFTNNYFKKGDILFVNPTCTCKVINTPKRGWFYRLLQFITFGLYKARWYYTVKPIKDNKVKSNKDSSWIDHKVLEFENEFRRKQEYHWWTNCPDWLSNIIISNDNEKDN